MACKICDSAAHNRRKCKVDVRDITPQKLWEIRRYEHRLQLEPDKFKYSPWRDEWKDLPEWRREQIEATHAELVKLMGGARIGPSIQATSPQEPAVPTVQDVERTILVVDAESDEGVFNKTANAVIRPSSWEVHLAYGLAAGTRAALALRIDHVVLCVGMNVDKASLAPWIRRLHSIIGVQVIVLNDTTASLTKWREEMESIGADHWMTCDRIKDSLERAIADWVPKESIKPPRPWTAPLLRAAN